MNVDIRLAEGATLPTYGSAGAAGLDLASLDNVDLEPGKRVLVRTGVFMAIPSGHYGRVAPRSGLAYNNGIDVLAGVVDSDYRGEIGVILINLGVQTFSVRSGMRIAQLLICPVNSVDLVEVDELRPSGRGKSGYGSTGL